MWLFSFLAATGVGAVDFEVSSFDELFREVDFEEIVSFSDIFTLEDDKDNEASGSSQMVVPVYYKTPENLDELFVKYANEYNVSAEKLRSIAYCESTFNPMATNYIYAGLFQFAPATWESNRRAMGLDTDINLRFNAEEAIRTAAFKISRDGVGAWPVCQYK